jgi:hypothetical protein
MLVRCKPLQFLQGKKTPQKVRFAKRQAVYNRSAGAVFVLDTEGQHPRVLQELTTGRNSGFASFPMAVGVAHACIEAWLLCDAVAIAQVLSLAGPPTLPSSPENLPAPSNNRSNNPKVVLGNTAVPPRADLSADEKWQIAEQMDLASVRSICLCFEAFALEVETRILPLFQPPPSP